MDGLTALKGLRAKEQTPATPAIVLLSNTKRRLVERFRELGAVDYLPKQTTDPEFLQLCLPGFALVVFRRSRDG
jgi:CheY-like chemotaxis protein